MALSQRELQDRNYKRLAWSIVGGAFIVVLLYGWQVGDGHRVRTALGALLLAAAPFALGGLAGFLFGIPKTLQENGAEGSTGKRHGWQANTNLEQVSDWLTKILIGVGLTQLQEIPGRLQSTAEYAAESLGTNVSAGIIEAVLITFAIAGFVIAYLLTKFDLGFAIDVQDGLMNELAKAIVKNPNDRSAVESYMVSSLYLEPPEGFDGAIQAGESFLGQEGHPKDEDGNIFAYLACAYGQRYAYRKANKASTGELEQLKKAVIDNVREALKRAADEWRPKLRQFANPPVGSRDDDLASLKDDPQLRELLGMS